MSRLTTWTHRTANDGHDQEEERGGGDYDYDKEHHDDVNDCSSQTILMFRQSYMVTYGAYFGWYHQCLAMCFYLIILKNPYKGSKKFLFMVRGKDGPRWIKRKGWMNTLPCAPSGEQQPWDHRHGRDQLGLTAFLCCWFPNLRKEAGSSVLSMAPPNTYLSYLFPSLC